MEFKLSIDSSIMEMAETIKALADLVPEYRAEEKEILIEKLSKIFLGMVKT